MADNKLLPCPFCGGEAVTLLSKLKLTDRELWGVMCRTPFCAAIPPSFTTEDEAMSVWNTRDLVEINGKGGVKN